jgi:hypothetical protein
VAARHNPATVAKTAVLIFPRLMLSFGPPRCGGPFLS